MPNDGRYLMQVLVTVAKHCRPNSPYAGRAWTRVQPIYGVPEFGNALSILIRHGFLDHRENNLVKPSAKGYERVAAWKVRHRALRARPILYARLVWDVSPAQEECISVPDGKDAVNAPHRRDAINRRGSARPSRLDDRSLQIALSGSKPARGTLAHAVLTGEVASDLMYRVAPRDTLG